MSESRSIHTQNVNLGVSLPQLTVPKLYSVYYVAKLEMEMSLCRGELVSTLKFHCVFCLSYHWQFLGFVCLLKLAKYLLINTQLAILVLDKPVAQASLLGGTVVSNINSHADLEQICLVCTICSLQSSGEPSYFASIFQLMKNVFEFIILRFLAGWDLLLVFNPN